MVYTFFLYGLLAVFAVVVGSRGISSNNSKSSFKYIIIVCLVLALFAAFRGETGTDSLSYRNIYEDPSRYFSRDDIEIGFKILMFIANSFFCSYRVVFFIMNFFTSYFVFDAIRMEKENINVKIALLVYVLDLYLFSFNIMRQALAVAICLWAYVLWNHEKKKKSAIAIVIAILFHKVAVIWLFVLLFSFWIKNKYYKSIGLLISILGIILVTNRSLMLWIVSFFTNQNKHYLLFFSENLSTNGNVIGYFVKIIPILLLGYFSLYRTKENIDFRKTFLIMVLGYILSLTGEFTSSEVERIGYYFAYCRILVLGFITAGNIKINRFILLKKQITFLVVLYIIIVYFYNFYIAGACMVVPYLPG